MGLVDDGGSSLIDTHESFELCFANQTNKDIEMLEGKVEWIIYYSLVHSLYAYYLSFQDLCHTSAFYIKTYCISIINYLLQRSVYVYVICKGDICVVEAPYNVQTPF